MPEQLKLKFGIPRIIFDEKGILKEPHRKGIIYSTNPKIALAKDGNNYIMKGPDINIVAAELSACILADSINIPIPDFGYTETDSEKYFVSKEQQIKDVEDILRYGFIENFNDIPNIIAFDVLIANPDRNMGNFVASIINTESQPRFFLYAIDFEKSRMLNPGNIIAFTNLNESYRPRGILGRMLEGITYPTDTFINRIINIPYNKQIFHLLEQIYDILEIKRETLQYIKRRLMQRISNFDTHLRRCWK